MTKSKKVMSFGLCLLTAMSMTLTSVATTSMSVNAQTPNNDTAAGIEGRSDEYDPYDFIDEDDEVIAWVTKLAHKTSESTNKTNKTNKRASTVDVSPATDIATIPTSNAAASPNKGLYLNVDNVAESSNLTKNQIKDFIRTRTQWEGLEDYLIECDKEINLIFLLAVARTETGAGASCVGRYNCFNIKGPGGGYRNYNSYQESIDHFIRLIKDSYISPDGKYYCGTGIDDIGVHYAESNWAPYVENICWQIYNKCAKIAP